jgi:hypothetical protein
MKHYGFTEKHIRTGMTGMKGWVFRNWAIENEASLFGEKSVRKSKAYIAQEIDKIIWAAHR